MRKYRRPFYRRPWLWVVVIVLLIGSGWFIANQNQNERVEKDTVVMKAPKKAKHDKKSKKHSTKEAKQQSNSTSQQQSNSASQSVNPAPQSGQQSTSGSYANRSDTQVTMPNTENSTLEPWVDPDNYEPNSIIGDRSTMHCYLPGQNPYPEIAPENIVYFNSLAEAQAAGYSTVQ